MPSEHPTPDAFQSLKLQIANDRQFLDFEDDVDAAARAFFRQYSCGCLIEKPKGKNCLKIALNLLFVVRIARTGLNLIKDIVFSEAPVAGDVNRFDQALALSINGSRF